MSEDHNLELLQVMSFYIKISVFKISEILNIHKDREQ